MSVEAVGYGVLKLMPVLINCLIQAKNDAEDNKVVANEIQLFVDALNQNMSQLIELLPQRNSSWAFESLEEDVIKATKYVEDCLNKGFFRSLWDAKKVTKELARLRQELIHNIQVKLIVTTLEVAVEGEKKMDNFQARMAELSAAHSYQANAEIRKLLQPVLIGMRKQDQKLQSFFEMFRGSDNLPESSEETQKFLGDILANLEDLTEESGVGAGLVEAENLDPAEFCDPITFELMCDPVKCSNGRTYDRWTVIQNNSYQVEPLKIVCDDVDVRGRLFERYPEKGLDKTYRSLRKSYREEALRLFRIGRYGEALTAIEHVLEWDPTDIQCLRAHDDLKNDSRLRPDASQHATQSSPLAGTAAELKKPLTQQIESTINETVKQGNQGLESVASNWKDAFKDSGTDLGCRICLSVCCFPCSLICVTCLLPELFKKNPGDIASKETKLQKLFPN